MRTLNVGIIGFGFMGRVHSYGYLNLPFYFQPVPVPVKLLGVCTARPETARRARDSFGFELAVTDYRELVNHPQIDIVNICSPNNCHLPQLLEAIRAGRHVYCDKPLVVDGKEADTLERALEGARGTHQVTFHLRFYPAVLKARALIGEGALGEAISFRVAYYHSGSVDPARPMGWKQERAAGGGVLNDLGSHAVDLARFLVGEFKTVSGMGRVLYPRRPDRSGRPVAVEAEDCVIISAEMAGGALGTVEASKVATGTQDELRFEIYGTRGALRYNSMDPNFLDFYDQADPDEPLGGRAGFRRIATVNRYPPPATAFPGAKFSGGWLAGHVHCLGAFLEAVRDGRPGAPSFRDGLANVRLLERVRAGFGK